MKYVNQINIALAVVGLAFSVYVLSQTFLKESPQLALPVMSESSTLPALGVDSTTGLGTSRRGPANTTGTRPATTRQRPAQRSISSGARNPSPSRTESSTPARQRVPASRTDTREGNQSRPSAAFSDGPERPRPVVPGASRSASKRAPEPAGGVQTPRLIPQVVPQAAPNRGASKRTPSRSPSAPGPRSSVPQRPPE